MIPFFILLTAAAALAVLARRSFAETLPLSVLAAALLTYLCTGAGHKSMALPLSALAALAVLVLAVVKEGRQKGGAARWRALAGPALAAFLLAAAAAFLCAGHMRLINFDDVAHWALYTRQQCGLEHFPNVLESASEFADYPPGVQMLAVFLQIGAPFRLATLFTAQFLWCAALALPLLKHANWAGSWWKNALWAVGGGLLLLGLPAWFTKYYTYSLAAAETVMGLLLGYVLITAWQAPRPRLLDAAGVSMALSLLMIAKSTGPMYAAFGLAAALLLWAKPLWAALRRPLSCLAALAAVAAPFAFWGSWKALCLLKHTSSYFTQDAPGAYSAANLREFFRFGPHVRAVALHYLEYFCTEPMNQARLGLSALAFLGVVWLLALLAARWEPTRRGQVFAAFGLLTACFLVYAVMLCYSYLYLFKDWEGAELSAYHRYIMPLPLAMGMLAAAALAPHLRRLWRPGRRWQGCALALGGMLIFGWGAFSRLTPAGYKAQLSSGQAGWYAEFEQYEAECAAAAQRLGNNGARVIILTEQPSWGHSSRLFKYFFAPGATLALNPQEYGDLAAGLQTLLTNERYTDLWCAPDSEQLLSEYGFTDSAGRPLQAGAAYAFENNALVRLDLPGQGQKE